MKPGLNLRVYRRTLEYIALLWNKSAVSPEQLKSLEINTLDGKVRHKVTFATSEQMESILEEGLMTPDDTVLALIKHDSNKMDPYMDYTLELNFDKEYHSKILVYAFGVLPPMEKDDKKSNVHEYGYVAEEQKWAKFPLVRLKDGTLAVPVILKRENPN
jgi:hypothetical protein